MASNPYVAQARTHARIRRIGLRLLRRDAERRDEPLSLIFAAGVPRPDAKAIVPDNSALAAALQAHNETLKADVERLESMLGNVNAPAEGAGARKKTEDQPHAQLAYAPGVEMPRQIETEREAVPIAGGAGL